jgi:dipeptidyl aminopeptidase/acylaminoacyl peptidase
MPMIAIQSPRFMKSIGADRLKETLDFGIGGRLAWISMSLAWRSDITARMVTEAMAGLDALQVDDGAVYWLERRPGTGRAALVRLTPGQGPHDVTGAETDVRSRVHEYGGGALHVRAGVSHFVNGTDQQVFRHDAEGETRLTDDACRYADMRPLASGDLVAVRECHDDAGVVNDIVHIDGAGRDAPTVLVSGADFYASPRPSPDGRSLAWLSWDHPSLPWIGTELWLGRLTGDGHVSDARLVAGGPGESVFQPDWSPDGTLHFASDRSGWWNLYRMTGGTAEPVAPMAAEFGWPQWGLDPQAYCFLGDDRIACLVSIDGAQRLGVIEPGGKFREIALPFRAYRAIATDGRDAYAIAAAPDRPAQVVRVDLAAESVEVLHAPGAALDRRRLSRPEAVDLAGSDGRRIHGLFYPPWHPDFPAGPGSAPPLILMCHGGPTVQVLPGYRPGIHFWTSRGFAVLEINYRGSSGWGRDYREALDGRWGIAEVADCADAARQLAAEGRVDPERMVIRGSSAGGFTTLAALAATDTFAAGISYYGISDLTLLRAGTHKFESHALDWLIGDWPAEAEEYRRRSPLEQVDAIEAPLLLLHGRLDRVVPVEQSELMAQRLAERGVYCLTAYFDDEGHGFVHRANVIRGLDVELEFLADVLRLPTP